MNPFFTLFLFAVSLLAIAAAFALLLFIANELQHKAAIENETESKGKSEAKEVVQFLSRMKASTLIGISKDKRRIDSEHEKN